MPKAQTLLTGSRSGCVWEHSGGPYGENLASDAGGGLGASGAVQMWVDEASRYDPSNPQVSISIRMIISNRTDD